MSLFTMLFPKTSVNEATGGYFKTLTAYRPNFTNFSGGVYEASLCRSAIHTFANQCSKLNLEEVDSTKFKRLLSKPNQMQTSSQFLYQLATTLECENTAFIFPRLDPIGDKVLELYVVSPRSASVLEYGGKLWLKAEFNQGERGVVELERVGILTKYQYKDAIFGSTNKALNPTLQVINAQNQGIVEGVKNSATIRFMAKLGTILKDKDIKAEQERFSNLNLSSNNSTGVMLFDNKYSDVKQIESKPFLVDAQQMEAINENVYKYFGMSKDIIMNNFTEDTWNAFYEGKVEPFAIQLSQVLTNMLYTDRELGLNQYIIASANRLQYASNTTKLNICTQLLDRGLITPNEAREIFNMSSFGEEGDKRYIRLEYTEVDNLNKMQNLDEEQGEANED